MNRSVRLGTRLVLLILVSSCAFASAILPADARTQRIADLGFRSDGNGFSFENYTNDAKPVNLTNVQMQWLFGKEVCVSGEWATCVLKPAAKRWMSAQNEYMAYGHCEGMAITSLLLFDNVIRPGAFGESAVESLRLSKIRDLQSYLAYAYAFQALDSVQEGQIWQLGPMQLVRKLAKRLREGDRKWVIHLFMPDGSGGHAVTPLAVDALGGKRYAIRVYDNNWPDKIRTIKVDGRKDQWRYAAASNPKDKAALYVGDADTQTLHLEDLTPGLTTQPCPFCKPKASGRARAAQAGSSRVMVALGGNARRGKHSHLLIKDERGRAVGYRKGKLVNTIPGAKATRMTGGVEPWRNDAEPQYDLPAASDLDVKVQDAGSGGAPESLSLLGNGTSVGIDNMTAPGSSVSVPQDLGGVTFKAAPGATQSPSLTVGAESANGTAVEFKVTAKELGAGQSVGMTVDAATGRLAIEPPQQGSAVVALEVERNTASGQQDRFANAEVPLTAGVPATVETRTWQGTGSGVAVTSGGTTTTIANQAPVVAPLPAVSLPTAPAPTTPAPTAPAPTTPTTTPTPTTPEPTQPLAIGGSAYAAAYRTAVTGAAGLKRYFALSGDLVDTVSGTPGLTAYGTTLPVTGGVWGDGHASFDGTTQYLELPSSPWQDATDFTWEGWVRWNGTVPGLGWQRVFDFGFSEYDYVMLTLDPNGDPHPLAELSRNGSKETGQQWTRTFPVGSWHHLVLTGDDGEMRTYLDGEVVASWTTTTVPRDLGATPQNWLGRSMWSPDLYFNGGQQGVAFYDAALTAAQVADHFAKASPAAPTSAPSGAAGVEVTITGTGIRPGATVHFAHPAITVTSTRVENGKAIATIDVAPGADAGPTGVTVENPDGTTATAEVAFAVTS